MFAFAPARIHALALCAVVPVLTLSCSGANGGTGADLPTDSGSDTSIGDQDSGSPDDTASADSGSVDSGAIDSGSIDTGAPSEAGDDSTADPDADATIDTGTVATDTGSDDTGTIATDTGTPDTGSADTGVIVPDGGTAATIKTVFVIMMENHDWSAIKGSGSAPYINDTLLPKSAYLSNYKTPPGNHPSEPNYIWLEAGDNLGITNDNDPSSNHQTTTNHFVSQLVAKGITWKAYAEDIDGTSCPLTAVKEFAPKHTAMLFFDDVTEGNSATSANCISHVRPFTELATDLSAGTVARFNMITPNLCNDMHGETFSTACGFFPDLVKKGDDWLKTNVPIIEASAAFKDGGAIFIIWDEGSGLFGAGDGPIGLIVDSPLAKPGAKDGAFTHSSTLKTFEEIFSVPLIRDALTAATSDLSSMFKTFP